MLYICNVTALFTSKENWAKKAFCQILKRWYISWNTGQDVLKLQSFAIDNYQVYLKTIQFIVEILHFV